MAEIPLVFVGWSYDDVANVMIMRFTDAPAVGVDDPASFVPTILMRIEIPARNFTRKPRTSQSGVSSVEAYEIDNGDEL